MLVSAAILGLIATNEAVEQTCTPPPPNMVSWWPGEGNANDIQGSNNGTLVNGVTFAQGKVGQAFSFDGADRYVVNVGTNPCGHSGGNNFSVVTWIKAGLTDPFYQVHRWQQDAHFPPINGWELVCLANSDGGTYSHFRDAAVWEPRL